MSLLRRPPDVALLMGVSHLTVDGRVFLATGSVRNFAYGFLSVVLGLYLADVGLGSEAIGAIFTAALAGGAMMTVVVTTVADRVGRRRVLSVGALLMAVAGAIFALSDNALVLLIAAILGTISPSGREQGPFLSVEQAALSETTSSQQRTSTYAIYNLASAVASALGSLAAGLPGLLGVGPSAGYRLLLWAYVGTALVLLLLFQGLSPKIETPRGAPSRSRARFGLHRSRGIVAGLAALFALDSLAGGFVVQGMAAYWLHLRFGADMMALGATFFGVNMIAAVSFLAAAPLAKRIGLVNTIGYTQLPSNALLLLVPFMPNLELAVAILLVRSLTSHLDAPARQSYTMAVVDADERSAAAGLTAVARNAASAIGPAFAGMTLAQPALGVPFLLSGALKIVYSLAIVALFKGVRPPEEAGRSQRS